jgi:hypothetical protein
MMIAWALFNRAAIGFETRGRSRPSMAGARGGVRAEARRERQEYNRTWYHLGMVVGMVVEGLSGGRLSAYNARPLSGCERM